MGQETPPPPPPPLPFGLLVPSHTQKDESYSIRMRITVMISGNKVHLSITFDAFLFHTSLPDALQSKLSFTVHMYMYSQTKHANFQR